jgi:hypothetical protein
MVQPIDYNLNVLSPMQRFTEGLKFGEDLLTARLARDETQQLMGMRAAQEARAVAAAEEQRAAAEAERAKAAEFQNDLAGLVNLANGGLLTADAINAVGLKHAKTLDEALGFFTSMEKERQKPLADFGRKVATLSMTGNAAAAEALYQERIEAAKNTGTPEAMQEAQALEADLAALKANPINFGTMELLSLRRAGVIDDKELETLLDMAKQGQGAKSTDGFNTVDQKLRAAGIVPLSEGGDGRYEAAMEQSVSGGGKGDFSLTVDPQTGAVSFSQGTGAGAGAGKPATGYVNVQTDAGVEQRVITGSPAAQEVTATAAQLDAAMEQADRLVGLVKSVRDDQELNAVTGFAEGRMPTGRPSLSPEKIQARQDLIVKIDQLKGNVFLQAYESLKGSGQITEIEGIKAEAAIARMNRAQGTPAFKEALNDFLDVVSTAQKRIERQKSGLPKTTAPAAEAPAGGRARYDENGDRIK